MLGNSSFKIFTFKILGDNISQKLLKLEISKNYIYRKLEICNEYEE